MVIKEIIKRFREDKKNFSFRVAIARCVLDCPYFPWEFRRKYYEKRIYKYLEKKYLPTIKNIVEAYDPKIRAPRCETIWVMWWQGVEQMPPIVKACYNQLMSVKGDAKVVLITKDNWAEWADIPEYIVEKMENQQMLMAHFSDIIRCSLLKEWGGIWLDATIYVQDMPAVLFENDFYTLKAPGLFPNFISRGDFSTFLFTCKKNNNLLFQCLYGVFKKYWSEHSKAIDYLFFDYFIVLMCNHFIAIDSLFQQIPENRDYYLLNNCINEIYDEKKFRDLLKKSPIQKLSWRKKLVEKEDGKLTNYGFLLDQNLN